MEKKQDLQNIQIKLKKSSNTNPTKNGDELSCSNILKLKVSHVCYNSLRKLKISYLAFAGFQNTFIYL